MLEVRNLSKWFTMHVRGGCRIESFTDVSFHVKAGSLLAITGPSGIGKSSLLKCIYRTYLPSGGQVFYRSLNFGEVNLACAEERLVIGIRQKEIGYVSQFFHVMPRVPAQKVLMDPLLQRGVPEEEASERATALLSFAGLPRTLWEMYPSTFSGGEKQRLNILHAIITRPRLLLLDEPTASLDAGYKSKVMDLILELKDSGTAMVGVFHDRDALARLSDVRYDLTAKEYCAVV
jgi:alpha-D-ribose 1-methylphosphonate 5-triphosphate synthase subunit PhnL